MGRFGFGFPAGRKRKVPGGEPAIATIQPAPAWNGLAASGLATTPADPVRTTAKPAMRLLEPPDQFFTETVTVGVLAMANNGGSLLDNLGLEHVRVHYEGTVHDITAPTIRSFTDVNGVNRAYLGWWITLQHSGISGAAQLYFEVVSKDAAMQSRVIGPYTFHPTATLHDFELEVAATPAAIVGARYKTIYEATAYLAAQGAQNPRITVTETADYDLLIWHSGYQGAGYCTVEATVPITIRKPLHAAGANSLLRPRYDGMWFKGSNITFDFANVGNIYHEAAAWRQHVFEGVNFMDSSGRSALWLKGQRPTPYIARDNPYYLECSVSHIQNAFLNASLVRGCTYTDGGFDVFSNARCAVSNRVTGHHDQILRAPIDAMTVQYTGAAATATIELSGASDTNNRVLTVKEDGLVTGTFTLKNTEADFTTGTNYDVADVVAWLNGLAGWSATLLDDTRRATALSHGSAGSLGAAFAAIDAKSSPVTLHTVFDPHGDVWTLDNTIPENAIAFANLLHGNFVPSINFGNSQHRDQFFVNNTAETDEALDPFFFNMISQWSKPSSHVVVAHNSFANHRLLIRPSLGMTADGFCLLANNTMSKIEWEGAPQPNLTIADNHLHTGSVAPSGATGTTIGGDKASLFVDATGGNFAPAGELLANTKTPRLKHDMLGRLRSSSAAAGAVA